MRAIAGLGPGLSAQDEARGWAECWDILRQHGKTFHLMARLLGPGRGSAIAALYGFARVADDLVDERPAGMTREDVRRELHAMLDELRLSVAGESRRPRFAVLGETIRRHDIPLQPFSDMVAGLEMDLDGVRYPTFSDLELYCYRVAGTVGLMITPVAGYRAGSRALEHAKVLGTAMQLTNILRDVGEDARRGRIYLPVNELQQFNVKANEILSGQYSERFTALMQFQAQRAHALFDQALALLPAADRRAQKPGLMMAAIYRALLREIEHDGFAVLHQRTSLTPIRKLWLAWRVQALGRV